MDAHTWQMIGESLNRFWPEATLLLTFILLILADLILGRNRSPVLPVIALLGLLLSGVLVGLSDLGGASAGVYLFYGLLVADGYAGLFKLLFALAGALAVIASMESLPLRLHRRSMGEYYAILVGLIFGLYLMASAAHLVALYLAIELVSLCSYVLVGYLKDDPKASEAGLKYILYGAVSSAFLLYGFSLLYGLTGTLELYALSERLTQVDSGPVLTLAVLLALVGFGYKIAAVPFHFWAPDAYEGAPVPVAALLAVGPKAAGFAALVRFLIIGLGAEELFARLEGSALLVVIALLTMTLGNLAAIGQHNLKRMLAYSSIAHAGYALMGAAALGELGLQALVFYLVVYGLLTFGAFWVVMAVANATGSEDVRAWSGLGWAMPLLGAVMTVFMVGLTGLPPTAGFAGKLLLFSAVWVAYETSGDPGMLVLLVAGLLNSVISLYYYLKAPYYMFFRSAELSQPLPAISWVSRAVLLSLAVPSAVLAATPLFPWLAEQVLRNVSAAF
ncbi:MAG: NADH-quinone oxidoreductase subunit N [Bacteroidetes bacterium]|nr:NADH-quinone oxidoreductase subunit N [Rhodothermia bacterium]MCS7155526.1 NADH-quinone oxidoreductase subunit N [Bacteroidota bacterium]MCX7907381.1 NADH-quinone oxidoreductase subunit N [Bacteroidota bacterium]MDW8284688.1 NADH-quinone oxidoreductase subunit N [Bacteroidota bacterium]